MITHNHSHFSNTKSRKHAEPVRPFFFFFFFFLLFALFCVVLLLLLFFLFVWGLFVCFFFGGGVLFSSIFQKPRKLVLQHINSSIMQKPCASVTRHQFSRQTKSAVTDACTRQTAIQQCLQRDPQLNIHHHKVSCSCVFHIYVLYIHSVYYYSLRELHEERFVLLLLLLCYLGCFVSTC